MRADGIRPILERVASQMRPDGILLSGGLDTSLLSYLFRERRLKALTVAAGDASPDLAFSKKLARAWSWPLTVLRADYPRLLDAIPGTVRVLKTFCPMTLRNNVVIHLALARARALGLRRVLTGDGGDELFAGYRFLFEKRPRALLYSLRKIWAIMHFSAQDLGAALGVRVLSPFLHADVRAYAARLKAADFVARRSGRKIGKAPLRRAFAGCLADEFLWRTKQPIQDGSGSAGLTAHIERSTADGPFQEEQDRILRRDGVRIRDKEQLAYYEIYRKIFGKPRRAPRGRTACPDCGTALLRPEGRFCNTCGLWPAC